MPPRRDRKKSLDLGRSDSSSSLMVATQPPPPPVLVRSKLPLKSVVKIFTVASSPNFMLPWQMSRQESYSGSGFIISGRKILTNAHVVADFTTVRIRRHGGQNKFPAKVLCINHWCDLALLTVDDDSFWEDLPELDVANDVPHMDERVLVIGYPMGGDTICVTRGVVSRVTTLVYCDSKVGQLFAPQLLAVQIDAAINSGNSGGPVFQENGSVVGIAFSGYAGSADNIGYIIPYPVIKNFLSTYEKTGNAGNICDLGFTYELCENHSMQKALKLNESKSFTGVHVIRVKKLGPCRKLVKSGDVLMKVNGFQVANDGTVAFREGERVHFAHAVTTNEIGSTLDIELLRAGKPLKLTIPGMQTPQLIKAFRGEKEMPPYLIVGGAVFTTLSIGLIEAAIDDFDDDSWECSRREKHYADQEIVIRISWLSHPINHGYVSRRVERIAKCNDVKIRNIKHFRALILKSKDFIHIETGNKRSIYLDKKEVEKTMKEIMLTYAIPSPVSKDLEPVDASYEPIPSSDEESDSDEEDEDDDGKKKKKKKNKKAKKQSSSEKEESKDTTREQNATTTTTTTTTPTSPKKARGRPKKIVAATDPADTTPKKRGRKPKTTPNKKGKQKEGETATSNDNE
eukprot:m.91249 g.91249  ORF g.91249 m.91249 type:complete len:627 (+) comp8866_c0_seq2:36-1916(+)